MSTFEFDSAYSASTGDYSGEYVPTVEHDALPGFEEFKRLLDAPLPTMPKFEKLFARPSVFSDEA